MPRLVRPRLWNAHREIKQPVTPATAIYSYLLRKKTHLNIEKRLQAFGIKRPERLAQRIRSSDFNGRGKDLPLLRVFVKDKSLREFITNANLSREKCAGLLGNPYRYFSNPHNVPVQLRRQIYLPMFKVTLFRTPHLPPKYASFDVPLWFSKFDMKSYLASVYNVDVIHVRSTVLQQKVTRDQNGRRGTSNQGSGTLRRPASKKKMTVELVEPFVWPEEIKDLSPWEHKMFYDAARWQVENQKRTTPDAILKPNENHRKSIAGQARDIVVGKEKWKPTWQSLPLDLKAMQSSRSSQPS